MPNDIFKYLLIIFAIASTLNPSLSKPIIGILTNPTIDDTHDITEAFINPTYVKWLETAGAEVVPIHPWISDSELDSILGKVNGILFQGGSTLLATDSPFVIIASKILKRVIKEKDENNKILPLWGTCQGFELLHVIISGSSSVLVDYNSYNIISNLLLNSDANKTSQMFSLFSDEDVSNMIKEPLTAEFHHYGVGFTQYIMFPELDRFFKQTSFAYDLDGKLYVSSVEARNYPVYAVQFHPEKTSFDRNPDDNIPQGIDAIRVSQNFANYFVDTARSNDNKMTLEEMKKLEWINTFEKKTEKNGTSYVYLYRKAEVKEIKSIKFLD